MLQIVFLILISWCIIWAYNKKSILVLGVIPTKRIAAFSVYLFCVASIICAFGFLLRVLMAKEIYTVNHSLSFITILLNIGYQIRTVLTEELIFRGAVFYILLQKIGNKKAIVFSSILFGLAHCLNVEIWKNPLQLLLAFGFPFLMGLVLAFGFVKTQSIIVPFAIHFGWNLTQNYIFPEGLNENTILLLNGTPLVVTISYFSFFCMMYLPKLLLLLGSFFLLKKYKTSH